MTPMPKIDASAIEVDRAALTIRMRRRFRAAPERVFDAWTKEDQIARWWDPEGTPLAACRIDLREGGQFSLTNASHPDRPFAGTYTRVSRPGELGFEAMGATSLIRFEPHQDGTLMTVVMTCRSAEHLDQFLAMGIHRGTATTLDNLVAFLGGD